VGEKVEVGEKEGVAEVVTAEHTAKHYNKARADHTSPPHPQLPPAVAAAAVVVDDDVVVVLVIAVVVVVVVVAT